MNDDGLPDAISQGLRDEIKSAFEELENKKNDIKGKNIVGILLGYLSNGFILLIVGSIITTILVPHFQKQFDRKKENQMLIHECFSQFLLYSNSAWEEYYTVFPLIHKTEMTLDEYNNYYAQIFKIKLKRYDAYAKIKALAITFRENDNKMASNIEKQIDKYAVKVNSASLDIDDWVRNLYCSPNKCVNEDKAPIDSEFNSIDAFNNARDNVEELTVHSDNVASLMIKHINSHD